MDDLTIAARFPFRRMGNTTGPDHIEVNVDHAAEEVCVSVHCCGMLPIFPKSTFAILALSVFLCCSPCDQLHALGDYFLICVNNQEMDVV